MGRFRTNAFRHREGTDAAFRVNPNRIPTLDALGVPKIIEKFIQGP